MRVSPISLIVFAAALAAAPRASAEVTQSLRVELPAETESFAVENLAGRMRVRPGSNHVVAVATVHAADERLASAVRFDSVTENGVAVLRVRYPSDVTTLRYRRPGSGPRHLGFFDVFSSEHCRYDGRTVRVSEGRGTLLYADVEVEVPARFAEASFRNLVGRLEADGLEGDRIQLAVSSADVFLDRVSGDLRLEGGSGDVRAGEIRGSWSSTFGSGDCRVRGFHGEAARFHTGSGDVHVEEMEATRLEVETGSGDSRLVAARVDDFDGRAGSGNIELDSSRHLPRRIHVRTSSGNVTLRLPADASFEARARHGSGDVRVRYADAMATLNRNEVTGYRRGDSSRLSIDVTTGSGDLTITP